jgi:excinuclease UvrABC nuclease subunit
MPGADYTRIRNPELTEHYVYRLLGKKGRLLYIGCSMNLKGRLAEHRRNGLFGHLIGRVETEGPYDYFTARGVEREAILRLRPPYNTEWCARDADNRPIRSRAREVTA